MFLKSEEIDKIPGDGEKVDESGILLVSLGELAVLNQRHTEESIFKL